MKNTSVINRRKWLRNSLLSSAGLVVAASTNGFAHTLAPAVAEEEFTRLFSNENPYGPSPKAITAMEGLLRRANRYPTNHEVTGQALKEAIARKEGVKPENVILGNGSVQLLILLAKLYGSHQEKIIMPDPTFDITGHHANALGADVKYVKLNKQHAMDLGAMQRAVDSNTSLVMVCNPNNPTGTIVSAQKLTKFCKEVSKKAVVFVDEAYIEYADPTKTASMIDLVRQGENVIITRTFSKMYGLAGMRMGYALAPEAIIQKLKKVKGRFGSLHNILGLGAALASMKDARFTALSIKKNNEVMTYFCGELKAMKLRYVPSEANFIYIQTGKKFPRFHQQLKANKIKVVGKDGREWSRISLGTKAEMKRLVELMKTFK